MTLEDLGYHPDLELYRKEHALDGLGVGRVIAEHKERYIVKTAEKEYNAEILGNLRYTAQSRADFPAVGDWVAISEYNEDSVLIHAIFPRTSIIERQMVGKKGDKQIIAANIDYAFIVQAIDRDFSINRVERYLTICNASKVEPIILLNKIDLVTESVLQQMIEGIQKRIPNVPVYAISNASLQGINVLKEKIEKQKTYCLLGSSGVGKSTLLNTLSGEQLMTTDAVSTHSNRGKHITTHRELHVLKHGGILIDNPGMREVGITDAPKGLETTFESIAEFSQNCKFKDCSHTAEIGCAVKEALENGDIDQASYENYLKMAKEKEHFETSIAEKRKRDKVFGKLMKNYKKDNFGKL